LPRRIVEGFTLRASVAYADGENTDYPRCQSKISGCDELRRADDAARLTVKRITGATDDSSRRSPLTTVRSAREDLLTERDPRKNPAAPSPE
jgi:hypothetical protein